MGNTARVILFSTALVVASQGWAAKRESSSLRSGKSGSWVGSALDATFTGSGAVPGMSAYFLFNDRLGLQTYFGIPTSAPFNIGGGANLKYSVAGDAYKGFHLGGGLSLGLSGGAAAGSNRSFFINLALLTGVHFEIVDNVLLNFDSGLTLSILTGGTNTLVLALGGNSILLGASILIGL